MTSYEEARRGTPRAARALSLRKLATRAVNLPMFWPLVMFGTSGLAVTVANIAWARSLSTKGYAVVALWLTVWNSALRFAPFGADLEVNRNNGEVSAASIRQVAMTSVITGLVAALILDRLYHRAPIVSVSLVFAIAAGGVVGYASAAMRARKNYRSSLWLLHSSNYVTLLAALGTVVTGTPDAGAIVAAMAFCAVAVLVLAGPTLRQLRISSTGEAPMISLRKLWPLLVITASVELMMTSDRLITPLLLGLHDLAELAILLSLVGPPFRLLEMSVSYTLLPELASAPNRGGALRAIRHSGLIAAAISGAAAVAMLVVLEPLSHLLFGDKFHLTSGLVLAVVIAGLIRVAQSFANAAATALAPEEHLPRVAALGTLGAVLVVVGSIVGARWGLEGVIYGSILGWFFRTAVYAEIVREALRTKVQPASAVVSSPLYGVTKRVRLPQEAD